MTLMVGLHDPDKAELQDYVIDGRKMSSVRFSSGDHAITLYTSNCALAHDLVRVFEMHGKDSPLLGSLNILMDAEDRLEDRLNAVSASNSLGEIIADEIRCPSVRIRMEDE